MSSAGRILIIDDEPRMVETYREVFEGGGYFVEAAGSVVEARDKLGSSWDVILLDQKLEGSSGPNSGLDLIEEATLTGARVIIVTAFVEAQAAARALEAGAYDYVHKGAFEPTVAILGVKVRRACQQLEADRAASRSVEAREAQIQARWREVTTASESGAKGRALEQLLQDILRTIPGFIVHPNQRSADEEMDIVVENDAAEWEKESPIILVEAKNWSSKVERADYDVFFRKLERRHARCRLGLLVSVGGFTGGVKTAHAIDRGKDTLIILVDRDDLERWVRPGDRSAVLRDLWRRSAVQE